MACHHIRYTCACGAVIQQCRCPAPKTDQVLQHGCDRCRPERSKHETLEVMKALDAILSKREEAAKQAGRDEERAAIVASMRKTADYISGPTSVALRKLADRFERGEHRQEGT